MTKPKWQVRYAKAQIGLGIYLARSVFAVHMKLAWPLKTNILILTVIILLCNNPVTPLIRAPDKRGIEDNSKIIFLLSQ